MSATTLSLLASAVFLLRLFPQPVRLARLGVADGVSPMAAYNAVLVAFAWLYYGLAERLLAVWVVSVLALVPGIWQAALLVRRTRRVDVLGTTAWALALVVALGMGRFGAVLGLGVVVTTGPQVVEVLRSDDLSGVAPATWWVSIVDAALWGLYGLAISDGPLMGYGVVLFTCAVVVLGRLAVVRRRPAPAAPHHTARGTDPISAL
ncbi:MAG: hypothetical protein ACKOYM_09530 [Actinomycetes bacterium]